MSAPPSTSSTPISPASDTGFGPRIFGSELERRAAEVGRENAEQAKFIAQQKAEASLQLILAQPCPEHGDRLANPCGRTPGCCRLRPTAGCT